MSSSVWSQNGQPTQVAKGASPNQANLTSVTVLEQANIVYDALGRKSQASIVMRRNDDDTLAVDL